MTDDISFDDGLFDDLPIGTIYDVISTGNLAAVKKYLDLGVDLNPTAFDVWTPLMYAAMHHQTAIFDYLLLRGADALAVKWKHIDF